MKSFCKSYLSLLLIGLLLWPGCGPKVPPRVGPPSKAPSEIPSTDHPVVTFPRTLETGYSAQLGAFSALENAVRLTERLRDIGEDAYFYRDKSDLYKVRLGDFHTRREALDKVNALVAEGIVDDYFIVGPEDYALAKARVYGPFLLRKEIVRAAETFIGLPYQWGGTSPEQGFDCSGLTMAAYQMNGLNIPRTSLEQFERGRKVSFERLEKGDLVFFAIREGSEVSHVGIYAGGDSFIHAPGAGRYIRVDSLTDSYYSRSFVGARSYL